MPVLYTDVQEALDAAQALEHATLTIHPSGECEVRHFPDGVPDLKDMQTAVGGLIEPISLPENMFPRNTRLYEGPYTGYVNEEGLLDDLPLNIPAYPLVHQLYAGPVLLLVGFGVSARTGDTVRAELRGFEV